MRAFALLVALAICSATAWAQRVPVACQVVAQGGLKWDNGRWVATSFYSNEKFILVLEGERLTTDSAAKAMKGISVECSVRPLSQVTCADSFGGFLFFSSSTMQGGIAQTYGAIQNNPSGPHDTLSVSSFTCQPF